MREREPVTRTVKASEARQQWSDLLNQVFRRESRVIVEKSGIPVAAIISAEDLELLARLEQKRQEESRVIDEAREAFKDVPQKKLRQEVTKAVRAARQPARERQDNPGHRTPPSR